LNRGRVRCVSARTGQTIERFKVCGESIRKQQQRSPVPGSLIGGQKRRGWCVQRQKSMTTARVIRSSPTRSRSPDRAPRSPDRPPRSPVPGFLVAVAPRDRHASDPAPRIPVFHSRLQRGRPKSGCPDLPFSIIIRLNDVSAYSLVFIASFADSAGRINSRVITEHETSRF
jgi:hypothetical protein